MNDPSVWDEEELFFGGDEYYSDILEHIERAKRSIDIETYIFGDDDTGWEFEKALLAAHKRGVKVRLMVDGFGSVEWINTRSAKLTNQGLSLRIYHPIFLFREFIQHDFKFNSFLNITSASTSLNRRNHRKSCVVDGEVAWVGSCNISNVHRYKYSKELAWRDTGIRIKGDLSPLTAGFDYIWHKARDPEKRRMWKPKIPKDGIASALVRSNYTSMLRKKGFDEFLLRLANAKEKVHLTTAYMAPSQKLIRSLCDASKRGVDVRILLPQVSDVVFMPWIARSFYDELLKCGVKIYEYTPCVLHAKTIIIDHWAKVGSTNLNGRSLQQDLEVDVVLTKNESLKILEDKFTEDLQRSENIKVAEDQFESRLGRLILRTFKNWI
jgi:cardiolipin synthase A/B